jgi:hypothetical protein
MPEEICLMELSCSYLESRHLFVFPLHRVLWVVFNFEPEHNAMRKHDKQEVAEQHTH